MNVHRTLFLLFSALFLISTGLSVAYAVQGADAGPLAGLPNLQLWLRADVGVVTGPDGTSVVRWEDQSGRRNDALSDSAGAPRFVKAAWEGHAGVRFAEESYLRISHDPGLNADKGLSVFLVYRHTSGNRILQKKSNAGVTQDSWFVIASNGLGVGGAYRSGSALFASGPAVYLTSQVFDPVTNTIKIYADGVLAATLHDVPAPVPNGDDLYVGKRHRPGGSELPWSGDLFELIIFDRALADHERKAVEGYLMAKYGRGGTGGSAVAAFVPAKNSHAWWWARWGDEYPFIPVGSPDGLGPLSLPGISSLPVAAAHVFGNERPDLFVQTNGVGLGLYVVPWVADTRDGIPVFGTPVPVDIPTSHPLLDNGAIVELADGIHALWMEGSSIVHGEFHRTRFTFTEKERVRLPRLPNTPVRLHPVVHPDGRVDIIFEMPDGVQSMPPGEDRTDEHFRPYDGAGIWRGGFPYRYLYAVTYPFFLAGEPTNPRLFSTTIKEVRFGIYRIDTVSLGEPDAIELIVGSRYSNLYYYVATPGEEPLTAGPRRYVVGRDGNLLVHPAISATPIAYPSATTPYTDLIVGGEGALYYYRFTGSKTPEGNPVFEAPVPVLQKNADLYAGSLAVPSVVDWNGDGVLDIVAGNSEGRILFFENVGTNAEPAFLPGVPLKAGGREIHIQAGYRGSIQGVQEARWGYACPIVVDWNGDGLLDIVTGDITGRYTVYINRGTPTEPNLDHGHSLFHDGLELVGHWRVRPAVAHVNGRTALVIVDGDGHFHLYWRLDDYNVVDGGKLRLEDGSFISASAGYAGHTGRVKLDFADWDGDGVFDMVIGTARPNSVPNGYTGFPTPMWLHHRMANVLLMRNVGTNEEPVYKHPVPFLYDDLPVLPGGAHAVSAVLTPLGGGSGNNLLVGNEAGRFILYKRERLSLFDEPIVRLRYPSESQIVKGAFVPKIDLVLPESGLRRLVIKLGNEVVYDGAEWDGTVEIDGSLYPTGTYRLTVEAENVLGKRNSDSVEFILDNAWSIVDELEPPLELAFVGRVERLKTAEKSNGWAFATGSWSFSDETRLVNQSGKDEYLIWEAPRLNKFTVHAYARNVADARRIQLEVSADRQVWKAVDAAVVAGEAADGWHALVLDGHIEKPQLVRWFRLTVRGTGGDANHLQIGRVELYGE